MTLSLGNPLINRAILFIRKALMLTLIERMDAMAKKKTDDLVAKLVTSARLHLSAEFKATTGQRAVAFMAAASAELLSLAGGSLSIAKHKERLETYLDLPEVRIGHAFGDAMLEGGPLFCNAVLMRVAKSMAGLKEIMNADLKEFDPKE